MYSFSYCVIPVDGNWGDIKHQKSGHYISEMRITLGDITTKHAFFINSMKKRTVVYPTGCPFPQGVYVLRVNDICDDD